MTSAGGIEAIRDLLRRIGLELAFVDFSKPDGAGPLPDLLGQLAAALRQADPPASVLTATIDAQSLLSLPTTVDPGAVLATWHGWMEESLTAWEQGRPLPATPDTAVAPTAVVPAPAQETPGHAPERARSRWTPDTAATDSVAVLPTGFDAEMMRLFCTEAEELLTEIERAAIVLESSPDDSDTLATMFRGFHTLKGNAAVMRLPVLQRLAHEVESLLDAARRGSRPLDGDAIDVVLAAADLVTRTVGEMLRQLDGHDTGRSVPLPVAAIIARVQGVLATSATTASAISIAPTDPAPPPRATPLIEPPAAVPLTPPVAAAVTSASPGADSQPVASLRAVVPTAATVRVDTGKLDGLVDLVGELVIAQSMVLQAAEVGGRADLLARALGQLRGITADLQRTAMAMRMVPVRGMFQKMARVVRDTAMSLGKEIQLVVEGEDTEIDRTLIEELGDPLVHMIRNAADHGIETPAQRAAAGKPPLGTVRLRAYHRGGHVVLEVADDGRGLDAARIRAKAVERGLVSADAVLDTRETLDLIFKPGFSTAEQVTDLSGRGVGMDVVRRNLERVRGKIEIDSTPGGGTTFTISMPLTLAIIEGLLVSVADQRFVIPTLSVRESFRPSAGHVSTVHGQGELVDVRGRRIPLLRLGRHLGIGGRENPSEAIVVVLEAGPGLRCLLVDALLGKQEVVIKSLGETFAGRSEFAGAAILGDGRVGLILDPTALVKLEARVTETAA